MENYIKTKFNFTEVFNKEIESSVFVAYYILIFVIIIITPTSKQKRPNIAPLFNFLNHIVKLSGFLIILLIRCLHIYNRKGSKHTAIHMVFEYFLYKICSMKYGTLNLFDIFFKKHRIDSSGHLFVFSYSSYLLLRTIINTKLSTLRLLCIIVLGLYNILAIRTVMCYHLKIECVIGVIVGFFVSFIHQYFTHI